MVVLFGVSDVEGFGVTVGCVDVDVVGDGLGLTGAVGDRVGAAFGVGLGEAVGVGAVTVMI